MGIVNGCQVACGELSPEAIRAASLAAAEKSAVLDLWQGAIDLGNEFLASESNRSMPKDARLCLESTGMSLRVLERTIPLKLVLHDDYPRSSCVCATVDTHRDEVLVYRPWGVDAGAPILTHNTFFIPVVSPFGHAQADLAWSILRIAAIFSHETEAHISTWEWFKCQYLEWLLGSGHHRVSMRIPDAVSGEFASYWNRRPRTPGR